MPRVIFTFNPGQPPRAMYDLYLPVGYAHTNGPYTNHPRDVAFVQFLLKGIFTSTKFKPQGELAIDGKFGPTTHYWILYFQHAIRISQGKYLPAEDGYVYPYFDTMKVHYPEFSQSMIGLLNERYRRAHPEVDFESLEKSPSLPGILKGTFKALGT